MFAHLQFPLIDSRPFVPAETYRLRTPAFPLANMGEFLRLHGSIRPRHRGGVEEWSGEELFAEARRAIRFPTDSEETLLGSHFRCVFRRLHSDGEAVARVDVGMVSKRPPAGIDNKWIEDLLHQMLTLPVRIPKPSSKLREGVQCPLACSGPHLAQLFLRATTSSTLPHLAELFLPATTSSTLPPDPKPLDWWVSPGEPSLLLQCGFNEIKFFEKRSQPVLVTTTRRSKELLFHLWLQHRGQRVSTWVLSRAFDSWKNRRRLRIHLVRLHSELQSIRCILRHLATEKILITPGERATDDLHRFILKRMRYLRPREQFESELLTAARDYERYIFEGDLATLYEQSEKMRGNIARLLREFEGRQARDSAKQQLTIYNVEHMSDITVTLGNGVSITGDFVVAGIIRDSFNKADSSPVKDELKTKLKDLTTLVGQAQTQMQPEKAKQAAQDLQALVNEATSPTPRKRWYELSSEGLLDAAKTVAKMAEPIATAVKAVLALLG